MSVPDYKLGTMPTCSVDECDKPTRSKSHPLCSMHYHRQYRHGTTDRVATRTPTADITRVYRNLYRPGHPTANKYGVAYAHRVVLYDAIGPGQHPCHWCGNAVTWGSTSHALHVDHINGDKGDNRLENLVPACRSCNTQRGMQVRDKALRDAGFWSNHDTVARLTTPGRVADWLAAASTRIAELESALRLLDPDHPVLHPAPIPSPPR